MYKLSIIIQEYSKNRLQDFTYQKVHQILFDIVFFFCLKTFNVSCKFMRIVYSVTSECKRERYIDAPHHLQYHFIFLQTVRGRPILAVSEWVRQFIVCLSIHIRPIDFRQAIPSDKMNYLKHILLTNTWGVSLLFLRVSNTEAQWTSHADDSTSPSHWLYQHVGSYFISDSSSRPLKKNPQTLPPTHVLILIVFP